MDETYHEPWCDRQHTPRQRCNRALAPDTATAEGAAADGGSTPGRPSAPAPLHEPAGAGPPQTSLPPDDGEPPSEDQTSLQRDVAVATDMPPVSPYAAEEWERTRERLSADQPSPLEAPAVTTQAPGRERQRPPLAALIALVALTVVLWRLLRR